MGTPAAQVHHDIALQIRRAEFPNDKSIDKIADEDDTLESQAAPGGEHLDARR